jgi:hypothetical protein
MEDSAMISRSRFVAPCVTIFALLIPAHDAWCEVAVEVSFGAPDNIFPNMNTTHGWQFNVTTAIEVTHLGLYDRFQDGFTLAHPVGLWNEAGTLLAQETLGPGSNDVLLDNFRYASIGGVTAGDDAIVLTPGVTYTVGFFTDLFVQSDGMVVFDGFHTINPVIDYVGFGVSDFTNGLEMPTGPSPGSHRWGPNLLFTIVPAPAATPLLFIAVAVRRRRSRRTN